MKIKFHGLLEVCVNLIALTWNTVFLNVFLLSVGLFRLTDTKWRSVTTRQQQTLQITKWRASSRKLTSSPERFREGEREREEKEEEEKRFQWHLLDSGQKVDVEDEFNAAYRQVGWAQPGLSTETWRAESFRCVWKCRVVALISMAIKSECLMWAKSLIINAWNIWHSDNFCC